MPNETEGDSTQAPDPNKTQADMANLVNAAVSSHIKRFTEKQFPQLLEAALKPLVDKLSAPPPAPPVDEDAPKGKKVDPQIAALTQKLEESTRKWEAAEKAREAAEKKAREDRAFSDLKSALAPSVRPELLDVLANHLFRTEQRVEFADDGSAVFKTTRTNYGVSEDVVMPIKDGVESFLKSEAAKPYLPSPGVSHAPNVKRPSGPSSALPPNFNPATANDAQRIQHAGELERQLSQAMREQGFDI